MNTPAGCLLTGRFKMGVTKTENGDLIKSEPRWPSSKALVRPVSRRTSVRFRFGSAFSSKRLWFNCRRCFLTLFFTIMKHEDGSGLRDRINVLLFLLFSARITGQDQRPAVLSGRG